MKRRRATKLLESITSRGHAQPSSYDNRSHALIPKDCHSSSSAVSSALIGSPYSGTKRTPDFVSTKRIAALGIKPYLVRTLSGSETSPFRPIIMVDISIISRDTEPSFLVKTRRYCQVKSGSFVPQDDVARRPRHSEARLSSPKNPLFWMRISRAR